MSREEITRRADERLLDALLFGDRAANGPRALELELDDAGIRELHALIDETTHRLRDVGLAAQRRTAEAGEDMPASVTVGMRFRAPKR